jgi:hypothetical protein
VRISPRTLMELAGLALLGGLLIWQVLVAQGLRASLADQRTRTALERTHRVAAEASHESCKAALTQVGKATDALRAATQSAYAATDEALSVAQTRRQTLSPELARILAVRPGPNNDCEIARGLAQDAWKEGQ